jgi:hypothetical protein
MEPELEDIEVMLPAPGPIMVDGVSIMETEDGGVEINLEPEDDVEISVDASVHGANLADHVGDETLNGLASTLLEGVDQDKQSRTDWESMLAKGIELMGLKIEERTTPFEGACGVFDPLMAEAVVRWQSSAMAELFPAKGPVKTQVIGIPNVMLEDQASRVEQWMNLYLTQLAPEYIEEKDQMMMWLPLMGSTFVKPYQDPVLRRPVARFKTPYQVIVPYGATDLETCPRYTCIEPMTKRQLKGAMLNGAYRNVDLEEPQGDATESEIKDAADESQGVSSIDVREEYEIYEVYCDLDLKGFEHPEGLPLPYIVSIEKDTQQVLAIRRNWREGDDAYSRKAGLIHYRFMPGFGFYGIGYAHLLGNSALAATMGERNLIDAATLKNFPGGVRAKGIRFEDNNFTLAPGEFKEVDTGGQPLQNVFMPLPYAGADPVLQAMTQQVRESARGLANTTEVAVGEGRQDAPVGTTVALMEAANLVKSGTIKRAFRALGKELKAIADLFGEHLGDEPYPFPVRGGQQTIMKADFVNNVDVIPVADPNVVSSTQRMVRAEGIVRMAQQFPQVHNLPAALAAYYNEIGLDQERIAAILPPPQQPPQAVPLDPLTENMNAMMNRPLVAGEYQDHDAHIAAHSPLAEQNPSLQAHIAEHMAFRIRLQVQQIIGQQLPPPGTPMPPQMENQLAMMVAQAMQQLAPMYKSQPQVDPVIQTEQMRVAAMQEKAQIDAQTKVAVAQINSQARVEAEQVKAEIDKATIISDNANAEADRQNRLAIEAIKAGNV